MEKQFQKIKDSFLFLKDLGYEDEYSKTKGALGDRNLLICSYTNEQLKRKIEFVLCDKDPLKRCYAYLINFENGFPKFNNYKQYVSFDRLKCFLNENEAIFFGMEQYELDYKIEEIKKIITKLKPIFTSVKWLDYQELIQKEKDIYVLTTESVRGGWVNEIKGYFDKNKISINYNFIEQPNYENNCLVVTNKYGNTFQISHGYIDRDTTSFSIKLLKNNQIKREFELKDGKYTDVIKKLNKKYSL